MGEDPGVDPAETFNPWSVVNLVFHHLAAEGLHPVLGATGDPGEPAADLLRALGIAPTVEGNRHVSETVHDQLAELRTAFATAKEQEGGWSGPSSASR